MCCTTTRDHPRVCGEKRTRCGCLAGRTGSPPRMRGKAIHGLALGVHAGITPAYAGKSDGTIVEGKLNRDHPRVCGEKTYGN